MSDQLLHVGRGSLLAGVGVLAFALLVLGVVSAAEILSGKRRKELRYAQAVAIAAASKLCAPGEWRPFGDVTGCLSQIDNALSGLERRPSGAYGDLTLSVDRSEAGQAWVICRRSGDRLEVLAEGLVPSPSHG